MPTPTPAQARSHHAERSQLAAAAAYAVAARVAQRRPWAETLTLFASYQLRAAGMAIRTMAGWGRRPPTANPAAFAGTSSLGYAISEPIVATIDRVIPAPVEDLPAPWWDDSSAFDAQLKQLIESEIADAARAAAQAEMNAQPEFQRYIRLLVPPSCKRCVVLANRVYTDLDGFERHPQCDCVHVPVASMDEALDRGLIQDPRQLVEQNLVRGLSAADRQAILDGAKISTVVNATAGTQVPGITNAVSVELFGRRVRATTHGTTKRSAWRRENPSRLIRLRPEAIYAAADGDQAEALRLLRLYGYLTGPA